MSCFDVNAVNTADFSVLDTLALEKEEQYDDYDSKPSFPNIVKSVIEENNSNCRYTKVCKNRYSTNFDQRVGKSFVHDENVCNYQEVCKDPNSSDYDVSGTGIHNQEECSYQQSCPYNKFNIKNPDESIKVDGRDNCQFKTPKCKNTYAMNSGQEITQKDQLDDEDFYNYGCKFKVGCTDTEATNYDSTARIQEPNSCIYKRGCTYTQAPNYNQDAEIDDGSCNLTKGCTYDVAENFNEDAVVDDGSCVFNTNLFKNKDLWKSERGCLDKKNNKYKPEYEYDYIDNDLSSCDGGTSIVGCIEPNAKNYNPNATMQIVPCDFGSSKKKGCTYENASNYDSSAEIDDGSCLLQGDNTQYTLIILVLVLVILGMGYQLMS